MKNISPHFSGNKDKSNKKETLKNTKHNEYDRIFKENAEGIIIPLVKHELKLTIHAFKLLPTKQVATLEREVDFIYQIHTDKHKACILHVEFQTKSSSDMVYRMAEYHGILLRKYQMPIYQLVIYVGREKTTMRTHLKQAEVFTHFHLISLNRLDTKSLLTANEPELVTLALLSDFDNNQVEKILYDIINRLKTLLPNNEIAQRKYFNHLSVLGKLRKFKKHIHKILTNMPILYDLKTDPLYLYAMAIAEEEKEREIQQIVQQKDRENERSLKKVLKQKDIEIKQVLKQKEVEKKQALKQALKQKEIEKKQVLKQTILAERIAFAKVLLTLGQLAPDTIAAFAKISKAQVYKLQKEMKDKPLKS